MKLTAEIINHSIFTRSECRVLTCLCQGMSRQEIACLLCRSYSCISKQIESIAIKLDAHSAAEIVCKAVAKGIVTITFKCLLPIMLIISMTAGLNEDVRRTQTARVRTLQLRTRTF